ncbi:MULTISPECIES: hypothetical protein, partial [unclassified Bradyrhizobium]|uniref:hypothetical protein n=1 Tax=unclassified Bradyrhizobium TaxID=2631580 RepID=UPI0028E77CF0
FASLLENASINRCSRYLNAYGEGRVQAAPMARLQQEKQAAVTTGLADTTGLPCAMVFTAAPCSPRGPGLFAPVVGIVADQTPASGCRDHTA